jgi:hypothetical protein
MIAKDSLKDVERRAYRSTFDDGIYDIFFGVAFLFLAWVPTLESLGIPISIGYLSAIIAFPVLWLGKRLITIPRMGAVEFGQKRKSRRKLFLIISACFFFLSLPLVLMIVSEGMSGGPAANVGLPMIIGLVSGPVFIAAAYFLDYPRLYIYAAILFVGFPHAEFLYPYIGKPLNSLLSFGLPGAGILIYGFTLLCRFMKKYPKPTAEAPHVS